VKDEYGSIIAAAPFNVTLFTPNAKIKGSQKSFLMEKAVRAMAPVISSVSGPKAIEVVAHDLGKELLQKIVSTLHEGEDIFKKQISSSNDREIASKLRSLLKGFKDKRPYCFLFNYRDRTMDLVSLQTTAENS
jgi:hypothetical protein